MKAWFLSLKSREQLALVILSVFLILYLFTFAFVMPLKKEYLQLKEEVAYEKSLLHFMETAREKIKGHKKTPSAYQNISLLQAMEQSIANNALNHFKHDISQNNNTNKATIRFSEVPFLHLISWLNNLNQRYKITTQTATITPSNTPGIVTVELTLVK